MLFVFSQLPSLACIFCAVTCLKYDQNESCCCNKIETNVDNKSIEDDSKKNNKSYCVQKFFFLRHVKVCYPLDDHLSDLRITQSHQQAASSTNIHNIKTNNNINNTIYNNSIYNNNN